MNMLVANVIVCQIKRPQMRVFEFHGKIDRQGTKIMVDHANKSIYNLIF